MMSIDPAIWEQIEPQVRALMVAAFGAGFDAGSGAPAAPIHDAALAQLLDDTRRHWADGLATMETWRRAYFMPIPPAPEWLREIQEQ